ncbi:MAG: hypothetical protein K9J37_08265 [Saprospiraceae bacterium]|nr:hypothetical protein [Saprospiraceae bacterium]MCF8249894.1 hypothetical protein [Saprospiraceae bacterium]MCF8279307.1 hypothetical protein [Bacteroidales bacterium]MCF8309998.1 hypothetical protein [Saprospiraceae bacterium]
MLAFFTVLGVSKAQSVGLHFDPDWKVLYAPPSHFSLIKNLLDSPASQAPELPQAWRYCDLAFFCKVEVKMEKAALFPIKFRLGDVQYVDELEGKRRSY